MTGEKWDEAVDAIEAKIVELTGLLRGDVSAAVNLQAAAAVNHLAEAHAWLHAPQEPHGGSPPDRS